MKRTALLLGLRGSGKTTLGRMLAERTRRSFVDLDERTLELLGSQSIARVFAERGERAFRDAEARALRGVIDAPRCVIALGGGTPTAPGAAEMIRRARLSGRVGAVYLRGSPATLRRRMRDEDPARPSLTGDDPRAEIARVFAQRDALYMELADLVITIDDHTVDEVLTLLLATEL